MKKLFIIHILLAMPLLAWCDNINFADAEVKTICVKNWDTNGDGELSKAEAAAVTDLGNVFQSNKNINSFDELQYFTGLTIIGNFANCSSLTSVIIPNSVTSIKDLAFRGCSSLTSVAIPNSVTWIGAYAFSGCSSLTSITIPNSVTDIAGAAFMGCSSLTSITIPNSVTWIGRSAFEDCSSLTSVHISDLEAWCNITFTDSFSNPLYFAHHLYLNGDEVKDLVIPNSVTSIGSFAFEGCSSLTSVIIPNGVTTLEFNAFCDCSSLASISIPNSVKTIGEGSLARTALKTIDLPDSLLTIGKSAFYGCSELESILIPETVTTIAQTAFFGCKKLQSVTIPNSVTSIGEAAFYGCSSLTSVTIPNSVTEIGGFTFYFCSSLTSITIPNSVTSIGDSAFYGCSSLASITISNSVTSIGDSAFYGCSSLASITIPNSVTLIGGSAFYGCKSLTSVTIPNSVASVKSDAFYDCRNIKIVDYIGDLTAWLNIAFSNEYSNPCFFNRAALYLNGELLTNPSIPNSVTSIRTAAFSGCSSLTSVTIPNSVTSIGNKAFKSCGSLTSVMIPNSVTSIGNEAFRNCSRLTSVAIPNSVTSIGYEAFGYCSSLTTITIPNSVKSVGIDLFLNCSRLASIIWDADIVTPSNLLNKITTNMLFYTKDASYAPSNIKNVIVNGTAKEIVLSDTIYVTNFYCPREFTAEKISYTHNYRMTSGLDGQARGWETIALPFTVGEITHESKGKLLPFGAWTSTSDAKPFWLCSLSSSGFTRATSIEANTPYIICMPNNSDYDSSFNLSGNVTFSATNVKVPVSSSVTTAKSNDKSFIPAFLVQYKASSVYALNVSYGDYTDLGGYTEGSAFVSNLRNVGPFEAYMTTSAANAKRAFLIDFSEATGIDEIPTTDMKDGIHKVYNLNGQLLKQTNSQQELNETLRQLPAGVYVVNGKKTIVK